MGSFTITIKCVGDHGRDRSKKNGERVDFLSEGFRKPEVIAVEAINRLKETGAIVQEATITHWPGETSEVVDDLLTGERKGNF